MDELLQEFLAESEEGLDRMERCLTLLERRPGDRELVDEVFRVLHTIKGSTGFLGFARLERMTHAGETLLGAVRDGRVGVSSGLVTVLLQLVDELRGVLGTVAATRCEGQEGEAGVLRVLRELDEAGKMLPQTVEQEPLYGLGGADWSPERSVRLDAGVLDRMVDLVGELVLSRNRLLKMDAGDEVHAMLKQLDGVTAQLRETVMRARLQPVGQLFARVPRMVRELGRACGKQVRVECVGQETGLDKVLVDAVKEVLTHAIRNAVDHGIEPAAWRVAAGKPAEGVVTLRAVQGVGSVAVEVEDDGAGIAPERIRAVAVEHGVCSAAEAAAMGDAEALQLIFVPGFSTAKEITRVSGRGVGMDVVRAATELVGGTVEVVSRVGVGTTVRIRLPLALTIVSAVVVRAGGQRFCLPQQCLTELVHVSAEEVGQMRGHAVLPARGSSLPVVRLGEALRLGATGQAAGGYVAVLEGEGYRFGLLVEDMEAAEEIVVKPLAEPICGIELLCGTAMLACGEQAGLLQVMALAERAGVLPGRAGAVAATAKSVSPEFRVIAGGRKGTRKGVAAGGRHQALRLQVEGSARARVWNEVRG